MELCHFNIFGYLPNSEDNGRIFGIFLDNIEASKQSMKLDSFYDPDYIRFETKHVIRHHDQQQDICPDFIEDLFVLSLGLRNSKYTNLFTPRQYLTRARGAKLYVITNTLEAQHAGWDNEDIYDDDRFILGVFTHRCCAEKFLQEIIQRELYYYKRSWMDDNDYREIRKYLPIIREYTEGVSDPEFEKERKALKDLEYLLTQVAKDPNHPGRRWKEMSDGNWDSLLEDGIFSLGFDGKWSEILEDYLKWMEGEMGMDLRIEAVGLKSKDKQLQYAYAEIFRLKSELEKCSLISKKIYSS